MEPYYLKWIDRLEIPGPDRALAIEHLRPAGLDVADELLRRVESATLGGARRGYAEALGMLRVEWVTNAIDRVSSGELAPTTGLCLALGKRGGSAAAGFLASVLRSSSDANLRESALSGLVDVGDREQCRELLDRALSDPSSDVRGAAVEGIEWLELDLCDALLALLGHDEDEEVLAVTARAVGNLSCHEARGRLVELAGTGTPLVQRSAYGALVELETDDVPLLARAMLASDEPILREAAIQSARRRPSAEFAALLQEAMRDPSNSMRVDPRTPQLNRLSAEILLEVGDQTSREAALDWLRGQDEQR